MSCHLHAATYPHKKRNTIQHETKLMVLSSASTPMFITTPHNTTLVVRTNNTVKILLQSPLSNEFKTLNFVLSKKEKKELSKST